MRIHWSFYQQWSEIWSKMNWVNFDVIHIGIEYGSYKGNYFELTLVVLGFAVVTEIYGVKSRDEFGDEMQDRLQTYLDWEAANKEIV